MKKILVLIDFSDVTEAVIENAKLFAKLIDAELKIIHVASFMPEEPEMIAKSISGAIFMAPLNYEVLRDEAAAELKTEHKKMLEIKEKLNNEEVNAKVRTFLFRGEVSQVITSQIQEYEPDMVIMGSHGHGSLMKALLGSTIVSVLKNAKCPVTIIPGKAVK